MIILLLIDSNSAAIGYRKTLKIDYSNWCIYRCSDILNFELYSSKLRAPRNNMDSVSCYSVQTLSSMTQYIVTYTLPSVHKNERLE